MSSLAQDLLTGEAGGGPDDRRASKSSVSVRYTNAQLLSLAREGAPGTEELVYSRLAPLVNRLAWTLLGADEEHDDVVHDVFIRIFRHISSLRDADALDEWAARIAINTVRNELRKRRLRRWVFWDHFEDPGVLHRVDDFEGRELLARAYGVLRRLPPDEQVILALRLFQEGTLDELACMIGCSRTTAKRRLARARSRFARLSSLDPLLREWLSRRPSKVSGEDDE